MSIAIPSQRVSAAHVRELNQVIAHGQSESRTALVDINLCTAWAPGNGAGKYPPIDTRTIAELGCQIFAPQRLSNEKRATLREKIAALGGIGMVVVLMRGCDLFVAPLPGSARVVTMVIRHRHPGLGGADSVVRGRSFRAKLSAYSKTNVVAINEQQLTHSYSIWNKLFKDVAARFGKSRPSAGTTPSAGLLDKLLAFDEHVLAGELFDLKKGVHVDHFHATNTRAMQVDGRGAIAVLKDMANGAIDIATLLKVMGFAQADYGKIQVQVGNLDYYWLRTPYFPILHLPFDPDRVLLMYKEPRPNPALDWVGLDQAGLNMLRMRISALLESGLETTIDPFPETHTQFQALVDELGALEPGDLINRLDIGGFLSQPRELGGVTQRCQECIYYLPHRQWCDLPELPVPVKPDWWCRLWKI